MNYIPWKLLRSWRCLACGSCCKKYVVDLTWEEYGKIGKFWPDKVRIKKGKPYLARKMGGSCPFLYGRLCYLQMLNMKPFACKVWPFRVLLKPDKLDKNFDGLYLSGNREYFIYINPKCFGINRGDPADFEKTIEEVINLWNGSNQQQYYSTNKDIDFKKDSLMANVGSREPDQ